MPQISVRVGESETRTISLSPNETVLSGLLREGIDVPYGCQSGACHSCMLKSVCAKIPAEAQKGLLPVEKDQGYFLSCCCKPDKDMEINLNDSLDRYQTRIQGLDQIADDIWRLRIDKSIAYHSGQYITLRHSSGLTRSYSIASHPIYDDFIECHIRVYPDGKFSALVRDELQVGDQLEILGPYGSCIYDKQAKNQTLFLVGLGTGLSPLYGIVRDAYSQGHKGKIVMLLAASDSSKLYHLEEISVLQKQHPTLEVHYSVQSSSENSVAILPISDVYVKASQLLPDLRDHRVFLCGSSSFVQRLRKECFLRGASMSHIRVDEFLRAVD